MSERPVASLSGRLAKAAVWIAVKRNAASERADEVDQLVGTVAVHARPADLDRLAELLEKAAAAVRYGAR